MPTLPQSNPWSAVSNPFEPPDLGEHQGGERGVAHAGLSGNTMFLGALPADPVLPPAGSFVMWFREDLGELRLAMGSSKFKVDLTAV